jgi:hypothetical protein
VSWAFKESEYPLGIIPGTIPPPTPYLPRGTVRLGRIQ